MANGQLDFVVRRIRKLAGLPYPDRGDKELLESFIARRDHSAFAQLLERHGPMVLSLCRRLLGNWHDAEDAFQATFVVLIRKARSIRKRDSLASWLYGVAYRVAREASVKSARRHARERQASAMPSTEDPASEVIRRDLRLVLDEELHRLPDRYRVPLILCYLQGKTTEETARLLAWPRGTVGGRLARGRQMLRNRLARRGVTLSAGSAATLLTSATASSAVPPALAESTLKAASVPAAGQAITAAAVSEQVATLADGALKTMLLAKLKVTAVMLLVVGAVGTGLVTRHALAVRTDDPQSGQPRSGAGSSFGHPKAASAAATEEEVSAQARVALEKAGEYAPTFEDFTQRVWVLCQIARAQARAELRPAAAATLRKALRAALDGEMDQRVMDVAECAVQLGDAQSAETVLDGLDDGTQRNTALSHISAAQARRGDLRSARATLARIKDSELWHGEALRAVAVAEARLGNLEAAKAIAVGIAEPSEKAGALTAIASAQLRAGERESAMKTLHNALQIAQAIPLVVGDKRQPSDHQPSALAAIAGVQAEAGDIEQAGKTAQAIHKAKWQDLAWVNIAIAQVRGGKCPAALRTAENINDNDWKGEALKGIVAGYILAKDLPVAEQLASQIKSPMWHGYALLEIAKAQARAGQRHAASATFRQLLHNAEKLEDNQQFGNVKPGFMSNLARAQASVGEDKAAQAWIAKQTSELVTAWALLGLAQGLIDRQGGPRPPQIAYEGEEAISGSVKMFDDRPTADESELMRLLKRSKEQREVTQIPKARGLDAGTFRGKLLLFGCSWNGHPLGSLILAMNGDGTGLETVIELKKGEGIVAGRIAPDGRRLAFSLQRTGSDRFEAWLLEADGRQRKIADSARVEAWSPDGSRLACTRGKGSAWESFLLDVATGREQRLPLPKTDLVRDWSPDGRWLAVMAGNPGKIFVHPTKGTYPLRKIYLVKPDGSGREDLKVDPMMDDIRPRFSPDGRHLLYEQRSHREGRVFHDAIVYGLDGGGAKDIFDFRTVFTGNREFRANGFPCWSPDGKQFLWHVPRQKALTGTFKPDLVIASPTQGFQKRIDLYEKGIRWVGEMDWR
jgi:RNA polymerase sigma factor (sigma-70 family)